MRHHTDLEDEDTSRNELVSLPWATRPLLEREESDKVDDVKVPKEIASEASTTVAKALDFFARDTRSVLDENALDPQSLRSDITGGMIREATRAWGGDGDSSSSNSDEGGNDESGYEALTYL
jgi:hypothetical protein